MIYRSAPFSMSLNEPQPRFHGHAEYVIVGLQDRHISTQVTQAPLITSVISNVLERS